MMKSNESDGTDRETGPPDSMVADSRSFAFSAGGSEPGSDQRPMW
jgi:hypothetical protein